MKKDAFLEQSLCSACCSYYKPGVNEALTCGGYEVVARLAREGKQLAARSEWSANSDLGELLIRRVCMACEFREQDCDFAQDRTKAPCGGFIMLVRMLEAGMVSSRDLE